MAGHCDEARGRVLEGARSLFLHYGFRRTTMSDIAREAGMSRPTLYTLFANKQEVFAAVVERRTGEIARDLERRLAETSAIEDMLDAAFELVAINAYKKRRETPFGREVFALAAEVTGELLEEAHERFIQVLAAGLEAREACPAGLPPRRLAALVITSARGLSDHARDLDELRALLADLKILVTGAER